MATSSSSLSFFTSSIFLTTSAHKPLSAAVRPNSLKSPKPLTLTTELATLPVLSFTDYKVGETFLDLKSALPHTARAVIHDLQNKHHGTASTLTHGEVCGGGRKAYPQKKMGRVKQGSTRQRSRVGPRPREWSIKINRKEKQQAISTAMASVTVNTIMVEDFSDDFEKVEKPKTTEFIAAMKRRGLDPKEKTIFFYA